MIVLNIFFGHFIEKSIMRPHHSVPAIKGNQYDLYYYKNTNSEIDQDKQL